MGKSQGIAAVRSCHDHDGAMVGFGLFLTVVGKPHDITSGSQK